MKRKSLIAARKKLGYTQQEMAEKLNITIRYYQNIERGDRTGSFEIWDRLEEITSIHQKKLRELSGNHLDQKDSQ